MSDIHEKIDEIVELIKKDENRIKLKEANEKMENDEEVQLLSLKFSRAQIDYSASLNHYAEDSQEVKEAQKKLYIAKKELDEHPLVREYYHYLMLCNEPLRYLEFKLINPITSSKKGMC